MDRKYITTEDGYYWRVWEQKDYDKAPFEAQQMYEFGMFYWGVKVGRFVPKTLRFENCIYYQNVRCENSKRKHQV